MSIRVSVIVRVSLVLLDSIIVSDRVSVTVRVSCIFLIWAGAAGSVFLRTQKRALRNTTRGSRQERGCIVIKFNTKGAT